MQDDYNKEEIIDIVQEPKIIQTDKDAKDGQNKCPKCGATDIIFNINNGKLRCNFCRHEFEHEKVTELEVDISQLAGQVVASGAQNIVADTNEVLTFKCSSCAAEVVIDVSEATQARCHWCRNTLSVNQQIPNGAIPDVVLPFNIPKDVASAEIEKFVGKRKFFAHPKFKQEFTTKNIMGVYFPYMVVHTNAHSNLQGQGEHLVKQYTRGSQNNQTTYYDADLYDVEREFDIVIDGLTVEASADKLNTQSAKKTNNVINAIMPFDIENCARWNANYLKGFTSEKRDTNIDQLNNIVENQVKDIARHSANETLKHYNRGVAWSKEDLAIKGQQWKAAYLPVWLYSYQQVKSEDNKMLHYVAVNARTKETMGSVPIHLPKLVAVSAFVEVLGIMAMLFADFDNSWIFALSGFVFFFIISAKYRNSSARHTYEKETKTQLANIRKVDTLVKRQKGLKNPKIAGCNNENVTAKAKTNNFMDNIIKKTQIDSIIKKD